MVAQLSEYAKHHWTVHFQKILNKQRTRERWDDQEKTLWGGDIWVEPWMVRRSWSWKGCGKNIPGRESSKCKGPEAGKSSDIWGTNKVNIAERWQTRRVLQDEDYYTHFTEWIIAQVNPANHQRTWMKSWVSLKSEFRPLLASVQ